MHSAVYPLLTVWITNEIFETFWNSCVIRWFNHSWKSLCIEGNENIVGYTSHRNISFADPSFAIKRQSFQIFDSLFLFLGRGGRRQRPTQSRSIPGTSIPATSIETSRDPSGFLGTITTPNVVRTETTETVPSENGENPVPMETEWVRKVYHSVHKWVLTLNISNLNKLNIFRIHITGEIMCLFLVFPKRSWNSILLVACT